MLVKLSWPFAVSALFASSSAFAAGFQLFEQSGSALGNAFAGGAAAAEDASTVYFNPAGMTRIEGSQIVFSGTLIRPSSEFDNEGSTLGFAPIPLTGGDGGDAGGYAVIPNVYYVTGVTSDLKFGVGLHSPFGLKTHYDAGWVGRYHALTSSLKTIDINPSVSYRLNEFVSLGAGLDFIYADAELSNAIDFGTICFGTAGLGPATCTALGVTPQADDGRAKLDGNDWGYGWNLGALIALTPATRLGVSYRSKVSLNLDGDVNFSVPASAAILSTLSGAFRDTSADVSVDLPDFAWVTLFHEINSQWSVMADVMWTNWSRFKELRIRFGNPVQPDAVTPQNWDDSYRFALGAIYRASDTWKFRAGIAFDETPVPDEFRTPRIPDEDRYWISFGGNYKVSQNGSLDFAYTHMFVRDPKFDLTSLSAGNLRGTSENKVDILAVQYNYGF